MVTSRAVTRIVQPIVLLLLLTPTIGAENFRGETLAPVSLSGSEQTVVELEAGQVLLVLPDDAYPFVGGFELAIEPGSAGGAQNFALAVFGSVDPPASSGLNNLAGVDLASVVLADRGRTTVTIMYMGVSGLSTTPGSIITERPNPSTGAVAIQLVPFMKGMSADALGQRVPIRVTPLLRPVGAARVSLDGDPAVVASARRMLTLEIDGRAIEPGELIELSPGLYRIRATAGALLDYTGNIGIETGRIEEIALLVEEPHATVRFTVPSGAQVLWNGELIRGTTISAAPGVHTVVIRIGDFSVSRQITLEGDGSYRVGLDLDILVNRD